MTQLRPMRASRAGGQSGGEGEEVEKGGTEQTIDGLAGHVKEFGFYPNNYGNPLKHLPN